MAYETSAEYYRRREAAERALAAEASDAAIEGVHLALAEQYSKQAVAAGFGPRPTFTSYLRDADRYVSTPAK